ncbi:MAG: hypothetical protein LBO72_10960 [Helicobacteraceae bacterium]|nr:hypothetical protein [Helicobacteraceae bacterium]
MANFIAPEVKKTIAKNHKQEWVIYVDRNYKISLVCKHEHCDINDSGETQKVDFRIIDGDRNIFNLIDINKSLISNAVNLDIYAQVIADDREIISDASGIAKLKGEFGYALELRFYSYAIDVRVLEFYDKVLFATLQNPPTTQEFNSSSEIKDIKINGVKKAIILK